MQTMPATAAVQRGRSASMGTLLALGAGLALYQMTSLVLGPGGSRQLPLSLNIPAVEIEELSEPALSNVNLVLGTLAAPSASQVGSPVPSHHAVIGPQARISNGAQVPVKPTTSPVAPVAAPTPKPTAHPSPRPTPPVEPVPDSGGD